MERMLSNHQLTMLQEGGAVLLHRGQRLTDLLGGLFQLGIDVDQVQFAEGVLVWVDGPNEQISKIEVTNDA